MNWIIRSTKKIESHTNLNNLLSSWLDVTEFNWLMSDIDVVTFSNEKLNYEFQKNYSVISSENFKKIIETNIQIIWGVISAVKKNEMPTFDQVNFPYVEGNDDVWKNNKFQVKNSIFEITAWDSSYTIIKFKDQELSQKFKSHFDEAIELDKFEF
jgi:hypothetical protein